MNLLSERLKAAMERHGQARGSDVIPAEVARAANVSATTLNYWLNDVNGISAARARLVGSFLGVNPYWLETGQGQMYEPLHEVPKDESPFVEHETEVEGLRPVRAGEDPDVVSIPRVKLKLRAGVAQFDTEPDMNGDGHELVPRALVAALGLNPANLIAMRVRGESMEPMMFEDDVVIVDKSDTKPISREVYAVNFDGEACIKQLLFRGGQWYLNSLHPDHGPVNVKSKPCSIVGRVVIQPTRVLTGRL
jgi:phage repressor protein C with HTH and peptisase S24 domain